MADLMCGLIRQGPEADTGQGHALPVFRHRFHSPAHPDGVGKEGQRCVATLYRQLAGRHLQIFSCNDQLAADRHLRQFIEVIEHFPAHLEGRRR